MKRFSSFSLFSSLQLLLLLMASTVGCSSKWERKLSEDELVDLMIELYSTKAILQKSLHPDDTLLLAAQHDILAKYGLLQGEYDSIIAFYGHYKANRLSVLAARASEKVLRQKEYLERMQGATFSAADNYLTKSYSLAEVAKTIPEEFFPSYAMLSPYGDQLFFTSNIADSIYSGKFVLSLELHSVSTDSLSTPAELLLAYKGRDQEAIEKTLLIYKGGVYELTLPLSDTLPPGRITAALNSYSDYSYSHIYVDHFKVMYY